MASFPDSFLAEARSVIDSLNYAPPELQTMHWERLCEFVPEVCTWDEEAGVALATVLLHRSLGGLEHIVKEMGKEQPA